MRIERPKSTDAVARNAYAYVSQTDADNPISFLLSSADFCTLYEWSTTPYSLDLAYAYPHGLDKPNATHCKETGRFIRAIAEDIAEGRDITRQERLHINNCDPELYEVVFRMAKERTMLLQDIARYRQGRLPLEKLIQRNVSVYTFFFGNPKGMDRNDLMVALLTLSEQVLQPGFMSEALAMRNVTGAWNQPASWGFQINA